MDTERRRHPRRKAAYPVRFNLNPDHHFMQGLRTMGVGGKIRNVSQGGMMIDSRLDVLDLCQIFPEELEEDSPFELELSLSDSRGRRTLFRGTVKWYRLDEPDGQGLRHFQAGLRLRGENAYAVAETVLGSVSQQAVM
jgi:hypothetical protein